MVAWLGLTLTKSLACGEVVVDVYDNPVTLVALNERTRKLAVDGKDAAVESIRSASKLAVGKSVNARLRSRRVMLSLSLADPNPVTGTTTAALDLLNVEGVLALSLASGVSGELSATAT